MKIHAFSMALLVGWASTSALAQWQWLDKEGRKVFSDRAPPPDIPDKNVLKRPGALRNAPTTEAGTSTNTLADSNSAPNSASIAANSQKAGATAALAPAPGGGASASLRPPTSALDKELAAKKQKALEADLAKRKADEERISKTKIENCARAKQNQAELAAGSRISRLQPNGERLYLDDAARAAEMKLAQEAIQSNCN